MRVVGVGGKEVDTVYQVCLVDFMVCFHGDRLGLGEESPAPSKLQALRRSFSKLSPLPCNMNSPWGGSLDPGSLCLAWSSGSRIKSDPGKNWDSCLNSIQIRNEMNNCFNRSISSVSAGNRVTPNNDLLFI